MSDAPTDSLPTARDALTRGLLVAGIVAGPLYLVVGFAQAFTRPGFDPTTHDLSLLANGELGFIQIANLIITGVLVILCALGMRRALRPGRGATAAPILVGVYGLGLIGAGIFVADPMNGFPVGTPAGQPGTVSISGLLHLAFGGIGFLALIAACMVLARRFARAGERGLAAFSVVTGVLFLAGFVGIASGSSAPAIVLAFTAAVVLVWVWLALVAVRLRR